MVTEEGIRAKVIWDEKLLAIASGVTLVTDGIVHRAYSIIVIPALAKHLDVRATSRICVLYFPVSVFVSGRLKIGRAHV